MARSRPFGQIKAPVDYIYILLRREIEAFRLSSYETFEFRLQVRPADSTSIVVDSGGVMIGFTAYKFFEPSHPTKVMEVEVQAEGGLRIKYQDEWCPVMDWLETYKPIMESWANITFFDSRGTTQMLGWEKQARWWSANGKHFPLLTMPPEIRKIVYRCVFGDRIEPYPYNTARELNAEDRSALAKKNSLSLLLACRQVYTEAGDVLFSSVPFLAEHPIIAQRVGDTQILQTHLRHLDIALSHWHFFFLFPTDPGSRNGRIASRVFASMRLDRLCLIVPPPWSDNKSQDQFVKCLVDSAQPYIRGHAVKLSGWATKRRKDDFDAEYKTFREEYLAWKACQGQEGRFRDTVGAYLKQLGGGAGGGGGGGGDDDDEKAR